MCTVSAMATPEENQNLPSTVQAPTDTGGLEVANVSEEEARAALSKLATADPTLRKRIFSSLLRAVSVGGS